MFLRFPTHLYLCVHMTCSYRDMYIFVFMLFVPAHVQVIVLIQFAPTHLRVWLCLYDLFLPMYAYFRVHIIYPTHIFMVAITWSDFLSIYRLFCAQPYFAQCCPCPPVYSSDVYDPVLARCSSCICIGLCLAWFHLSHIYTHTWIWLSTCLQMHGHVLLNSCI